MSHECFHLPPPQDADSQSNTIPVKPEYPTPDSTETDPFDTREAEALIRTCTLHLARASHATREHVIVALAVIHQAEAARNAVIVPRLTAMVTSIE